MKSKNSPYTSPFASIFTGIEDKQEFFHKMIQKEEIEKYLEELNRKLSLQEEIFDQ